MKLALIGYGKMGKRVEEVALQRGHTITAIITTAQQDWDALNDADLCIEFSKPDSAAINIAKAAKYKKNIVVGTTSWEKDRLLIEKIVHEEKIGLLHSVNFSIGLNIFKCLVDKLSTLLNHFPEYDIAGIEAHHRNKIDAPSGTAKALGAIIEKNIDRIENLPWASLRCGTIPGNHSIVCNSKLDTIELSHSVHDPITFALGAISAAEWLHNKIGIFTFDDCLRDIAKKGGICL
jgi:4-hydroxy-tetrahydrodipicolinate reductase